MPTIKPTLPKNKPCVVCMRIRQFLLLAAVILAVMWVKPEWRLPAGYNYSAIVGDLFLAAFVILFAYKWWEHKRDVKLNGETQEERFEKLRERTSKIVADIEDTPDVPAPAGTTQAPGAGAMSATTASSDTPNRHA